jgi:hypothetical protein
VEYGVRVTFSVEGRDEHGSAEDLTLSFASFLFAENPAAAAVEVAGTVSEKVADLVVA